MRRIPTNEVSAKFKSDNDAHEACKQIFAMMVQDGHFAKEIAPSINVDGAKITISWMRKPDKKPMMQKVLQQLGVRCKGT